MNGSSITPNDPAILLLNEIDILLAQTRLMELYLKQAQATSANEAARVQQQHRIEVSQLRAALAEQEQAGRTQAENLAQQQAFAERIHQLEILLDDKETLLNIREGDLAATRAGVITLEQRVGELETAYQQAQAATHAATLFANNLQSDLSALRWQSEQDQQNSRQQQLDAQQLERELRAQLAQLQAQLADKQAWQQNADGEIDKYREEIAALRNDIAALQASRRQAEADAASELERNRSELNGEIAQLQSALAARRQEYEQERAARTAVEENLQAEIIQLRQEIEHKRQQIESRDGAWHEAEREIAGLRQRVGELEAAQQQAAHDNHRLEQGRDRLNAEIARLQSALDLRQQEHQQEQAARASGEEDLRSEISRLHQEIDQKRQQTESRDGAMHEAQNENAGLRERVSELAAGQQQAGNDKAALENLRVALENELEQLHHHIAVKERDLTQRYEAVTGVELALHGRIQALQQELAHGQQDLARRDQELANAHAEITALSERQNSAELARQEAEENWQRSGAIQSELQIRLQAKTAELEAIRKGSDETTDQLGAKLNELQLQLAEKQLLTESRSNEIADLKVQHHRLATQLTDLESAQNQSTHLLQETEQSRLAHHNEIAALDDAHQTERRRLENELSQEREAANRAREQYREFVQRAAELESMLASRSGEIANANAERGALETRLHDLAAQRELQQADEPARAVLTGELDALRLELQQKSWAMAQQQASAEELAAAYRAQKSELEGKLHELRGGAGLGDENLRKQQELSRALQQRVEELEVALQHAELTALSRAEQMRQESLAQIDALNLALKQTNDQFEEQAEARANLEQSLRREVDRLVREVEERNRILQDRNDELVRVKADLDAHQTDLGAHQEQLNLTAAANALAESAANSEIESMRSEFQAQLALLQAELSQKDWALDERRALVEGAEQEYRQEVETLRQQLSEQAAAREPNRLEGTNTAASDTVNFAAQAHERRWQSGFAAKRRWKV
ncbi:MAG: hypothetical protein EXR70_11105 [Deltaproteobacteria bacterium]|nr:hypothetical protein [Deltaproteobacteria bacterium]